MSSIYNHRQMVPTPGANRVHEYLEQIRTEYDQVSQEAAYLKMQRDEYDQKTVTQQVQEMTLFRQTMVDLEQNHLKIKQQYEDEILRLRRELEHLRGNSAMTGSAASGNASVAPPPQPPQIGHHGTTLFANIAPGSGPALPPQPTATSAADAQAQHHHHLQPPQQQQQQQPPSQPQHQNYFHSQQPSHAKRSRIEGEHTPGPPGVSPSPHGYPGQQAGQQNNVSQGYSNMQQSPQPPTPQQTSRLPPRSAPSGPHRPMPSHPSMPTSQAAQPQPQGQQQTIRRPASEMETDGGQGGYRREGSDWVAVYNPKLQRVLDVDLVHTLDHNSVVCCVKFNNDGKYLATGCNRTAQIYDVASGQCISILSDDAVTAEGDLYIRSVCFSPDGKFLATGAEDKQVRIWDLSAKRIRHVLQGHGQDIYSLDYSRNGRLIVSGSGDRTAKIWETETGRCLHTLIVEDQDAKDAGVTSVAFSPDGKYVAAGSLDRMVRVWDAHTGSPVERFEGHKDSVYSVVFAPDGKHLVSGSLDRTLKMWELGRGTPPGGPPGSNSPRTTFNGHKDFVLSVACSPCGSWVVSGSKDRGVQFWDPRSAQTQFMLQGHKNSVISVAISPKGSMFATGSGDYRARIWSYQRISSGEPGQ